MRHTRLAHPHTAQEKSHGKMESTWRLTVILDLLFRSSGRSPPGRKKRVVSKTELKQHDQLAEDVKPVLERWWVCRGYLGWWRCWKSPI